MVQIGMRRVLSPVPIAAICVLVALLALLAYGLAQNEPNRAVGEALARGEREQAPELELPKLGGGGNGSLADYRGEVVVLNFWAGERIDRFGVVQYPETFVIDRQGRIAALRRGPVDDEFMRTQVESLL